MLEAGTKTYDGLKKVLFRCYEKIINFYPDPEPFESVDLIESYRQYWKPDKVRVLLLAESHVYTTQTDKSYTTYQIEGLPNYPDQYARFVYCLAYGENSMIIDKSFKPKGGTPQFWKIFYSCINHAENNDSFVPILRKTSTKQRILNKIELLNKLRDRGIWLMDTSIVALYNKGTKPDKKVIDKSLKISWETHNRKLLEEASPNHIIVIGKRVAGNIRNDLKSMDIPFNIIEQPGAHLSSDKHLSNYQNYSRICKEHT